MKIISFNIWGGRYFDALMAFVREHAPTTDVFCFQEVLDSPIGPVVSSGSRANLYEELCGALPAFHAYFAPVQEFYDHTMTTVEPITAGSATFVRKEHSVLKTEEQLICGTRNGFIPGDYGTVPSNMFAVQFDVNGTLLTIANVHGTCGPYDKLDSPERLEQSRRVLAFMQAQPGEKIVMGDFNLNPGTESLQMFVDAGYRDLVKEYAITTTRGTQMRIAHPTYGSGKWGWQEFADYTFVTSGIRETKFEVPDVPLSDHLPMILECEV